MFSQLSDPNWRMLERGWRRKKVTVLLLLVTSARHVRLDTTDERTAWAPHHRRTIRSMKAQCLAATSCVSNPKKAEQLVHSFVLHGSPKELRSFFHFELYELGD